jgi:O-antigen ligase/tetratricopeptide (TPR) repeat protein
MIVWPLLAMLAAYCLFYGGGWAATYYAAPRAASLVLAFVAVGAWIVVAARVPSWRPGTVLAPAFAAALTAFAIATITSRAPRLSVEYLALAILLTALYLLLQRLMESDFYRVRLLSFAAIVALLTGVAFILVIVPHWITWWGLIGHFAAPPLRPFFEGLTFGNPSAVLTASVLLAAPVVANLAGRSRGANVAAISVVALSVAVIIMSGSRAGWLAIGLAVVVVGALWLAAPERRAAVLELSRSRIVRLLAVPILIVAVAAAVIAGPGFLLRATSGGDGGRLVYFATAIRMFESSPLVGTGPGTWVPQRIDYTQPGEIDYYIPHAHDIYVQVLAEFGIVGALAGLVVVAALARLLLGAIRDPDAARRRMGWAALFATVYFAGHQLLDEYANAPAILFAYVIPIAWLDATAPQSTALRLPRINLFRDRAAGRIGTAVGLGGVVLVVASATFLGWSERGASLMADGTDLMNDRKPAEALRPLRDAVQLDSAMPPYHFALGLALADTGDLDGAQIELQTATTADGLPTAWLDLAAVRARLGQTLPANDALTEALRLGVQQAGVLMGAGVVELELGDTDAAATDFAQALLLSPTLAGDPWWTADPARAAIWQQTYTAAFDQAPAATRFLLALEASDAPGAANAIAAMDPAEAATSATVQAAWNGDAAALAELRAQTQAHPLDVTLVNWCSLLLRRAGDKDGAADYITWAATVEPLSTPGGFEVRVKSDKDLTPAGISSLFYGHYTYRHPVPNHQLVDWLPELAYQ